MLRIQINRNAFTELVSRLAECILKQGSHNYQEGDLQKLKLKAVAVLKEYQVIYHVDLFKSVIVTFEQASTCLTNAFSANFFVSGNIRRCALFPLASDFLGQENKIV